MAPIDKTDANSCWRPSPTLHGVPEGSFNIRQKR